MMARPSYPIVEEDLAMLDMGDFRMPIANSICGAQTEYSNTMASCGKRYASPDFEDDSGFCSNLTPPACKVSRFDEDSFQSSHSNLTPLVPKFSNFDFENSYSHSSMSPVLQQTQPKISLDNEVMLLRNLIKEASEQPPKMQPLVTYDESSQNSRHSMRKEFGAIEKPTSFAKFSVGYTAKSRNGLYELRILNQPEEQHRARYLTEGSRGSIKDKNGLGHPVVKLFGPCNSMPLRLQCYIGHDKQFGAPHLFYQASKISGKNSTRCWTNKVEGVTLVSVELEPEHDMQATIDCIGILKERNVDVEQKLLRLRNSSESIPSVPNKKRSTKCRLVFRVELPNGEILQTISNPILCTQPLGTPEVLKKSLSEGAMCGGAEMFIIGKNFLKDSKVVWKSPNWSKIVEPDKEYLHSTHLVSTVPAYDGPEMAQSRVEVSFCVLSGGKYSDCQSFTYVRAIPIIKDDSLG